MKTTRRKLLQGVLAGLGALAAGGAGAYFWADDLYRRARRLYHGPPLPASPPGPLDEETADTLRAAAEALVGEAGRSDRYLAPFRWRADHVPGHLETYRRFAGFVDERARRQGAARFVALSTGGRRRLLSRWFPGGRMRHLVTGWMAPERRLLRRHVVREILAVYAATDAWVDLGYGGSPGEVRGLEAYRHPPPGTGEGG